MIGDIALAMRQHMIWMSLTVGEVVSALWWSDAVFDEALEKLGRCPGSLNSSTT